MIGYNLWECCNLHLYSRAAFQHASLLKAPLPFHQQINKREIVLALKLEQSILYQFYFHYIKSAG